MTLVAPEPDRRLPVPPVDDGSSAGSAFEVLAAGPFTTVQDVAWTRRLLARRCAAQRTDGRAQPPPGEPGGRQRRVRGHARAHGQRADAAVPERDGRRPRRRGDAVDGRRKGRAPLGAGDRPRRRDRRGRRQRRSWPAVVPRGPRRHRHRARTSGRGPRSRWAGSEATRAGRSSTATSSRSGPTSPPSRRRWAPVWRRSSRTTGTSRSSSVRTASPTSSPPRGWRRSSAPPGRCTSTRPAPVSD